MDLKKFTEAEGALTTSDNFNKNNLDELSQELGEQACFSLQILANIYSLSEQTNRCYEANRRALKLFPFLWQSFAELCNKGDKPDPSVIFQASSDHLLNFGVSNPVITIYTHVDPPINLQNSVSSVDYCTPVTNLNNSINTCPSAPKLDRIYWTTDDSPLTNPLSTTNVSELQVGMNLIRKKLFQKNSCSGAALSPNTPNFGFLPVESPMSFITSPIPAALTEVNNDQKSIKKPTLSSIRAHVGQLISRKEAPLQMSKPVFSQSGNVGNTTPQSPTPQSNLHSAQSVRRSTRLFSNSYSVKENNKSPNRNKFSTPKSPSRKSKQRMSKSNISKNNFNEITDRNRVDKEKIETITSENKVHLNNSINSAQSAAQQAILIQRQSVDGLMGLLRQFGYAYLNLMQFKCRKAIQYFNELPQNQFNTAWVLSAVGIAHLELTEYDLSVKHFEEAHELQPYRMDKMELYSTALWHLQREVALSALAQKLLAQNRLSPVSLLVAGNCFSLHKEHDTAIKFFERAVQVDPKCVYGYTLLGHELVNTEELEKAMSCFRSAIRLNPRHYNAWFGMGTIFSKQERFQLAELHYKRALAINTQSSVLMCHIGVVQHALSKTEKALQTLNIAIELDPKNPLSKFHRGSLYFAMGRNQDALQELEELKEIVPKESLVYYLIGKVHKKLGNVHLALMHFSWATDLDPKGANNQIKEAFDPSLSGQLDDEIENVQGVSIATYNMGDSPSEELLPVPESPHVPEQDVSEPEVSLDVST